MKIRLFSVLALAGLLLSGCAVEGIPTCEGVIGAIMESDNTRASVTDKGIFTWSEGDQIWLETTSGCTVGTLSSGAGTSNAMFSYGGFLGEITGKSVYPYYEEHSISGNKLSVYLPSSYDLETSLENTNAIMYGVKSGNNIRFNHLAGVMRFVFRNAPVGTDSFSLTLDKKINGIFYADLNATLPIVSAENTSVDSEKTVTLNFDPLAEVSDICLYVPLPVGTYNTLGISLKAGSKSVWNYSNTVTNSISRKTLKLMPVVTIGGFIDGDIEGDNDSIYDVDELDMEVITGLFSELNDMRRTFEEGLDYMNEVLYKTQDNHRSFEDALEEKNARLDELRGEFERYQEALYEIAERLSYEQTELRHLWSQLDEFHEALHSYGEYYMYIQAELDEYIDQKDYYSGFEDRIDYLAEQLELVHRYLCQNEEYLDILAHDIYEVMDVIEEMFNEIEQESSPANYDISRAMSTKSQTRSNDIESGLAELEAEIEALKVRNQQLLEGLMEFEPVIKHKEAELKVIANFISELRALKQEKLSEIYEAEAVVDELNYQIQVLSEEIQHIESNLEEYYSYYYSVKNQSDNYENYIDVLFEYINNGIRTDEEWEEAQQLYNWLRSDMEDRVAELEAALENLFASIDNR